VVWFTVEKSEKNESMSSRDNWSKMVPPVMNGMNEEKKQDENADDDIGTEITAVTELTTSEDKRPIIQITFSCVGEVLWLFVLILICPVRNFRFQIKPKPNFSL